MSYSLDKLNAMLVTPALQIQARLIMVEYQDAIDKMMADTVHEDVRAMMERTRPASLEQAKELANGETSKRMAKYGEEFFSTEVERLLDSYNEELYDKVEFNIRCEILSGLKDSLINFQFK